MLGMAAEEPIDKPQSLKKPASTPQQNSSEKKGSKAGTIDSTHDGIVTPSEIGRKKPLVGRTLSQVNKSVSGATSNKGSVFDPGQSITSFASARSKPPIKGGGGAFKTQKDDGDLEFDDL